MSYFPYLPDAGGDTPGILTDTEFRAQFPSESSRVEFKQSLPSEGVQQAIAAFSNTHGGILLAGVRDNGDVIGLEVGPETEARLHQSIRAVHDPGRYTIHQFVVGDRTVLAIVVARREEGFAQLSSGAVLVRRGASNVKLFGEELATFLAERKLTRFETTATASLLDDADPVALDRVAQALGWTTEITQRLREFGLVSTSPRGEVLTVAGCAFLLEDPAEALGKSYIEYFRYPGDDATYERRLEIRGPLDVQVREATRVVSDELGVQMAVVGVTRHELPRVPIEVLREALANAVAHRQYELNHSPIRVHRYPNRLEIVSPGSLPEPVTVLSIREQSAARNPNMIRLLRSMHLAEDAGLGIDLMQDRMKANLLVPPHFEEESASFKVTLDTESAVSAEERAWIASIIDRGEIEPDDRTLLLHAARGERLTNKAVRELLTLDSTQARARLQRLRDAGLLLQLGERSSTVYVAADRVRRSAPQAMTNEEISDLLIEMAHEGPLTNTIVRESTGLPRAEATAALRKLVRAGRLRKTGARRGTKYLLPSDDEPLPIDAEPTDARP